MSLEKISILFTTSILELRNTINESDSTKLLLIWSKILFNISRKMLRLQHASISSRYFLTVKTISETI